MSIVVFLSLAVTASILLAGMGQRNARARSLAAVADDDIPERRAERETVDIGACCRSIVRSLESTAASQFASIKLAVAGHLPVVADAFALRTALQELVRSVVNATPTGAVLVTAGMHGGRVQVTVVGDSPAGAAINLETVGPVVAMHGGTLDVEPPTARGTRIVMRLMPSRGAPSPATRMEETDVKAATAPAVTQTLAQQVVTAH